MHQSAWTRREWLATATASVAAGTWSTSTEAADSIPIVDTHTHFYDPHRPEGVPWPGKESPFLYRTVLPAEYREFARPLGVVGTVVVEASAWVADNQWILDLAAKDDYLLGLVGNLPPGSADFAEHFPKLAAQPKFLGIRVNEGPLRSGLDQPAFLDDLRKLQGAGRQLDVNGGPTLLPLVDRLAAALPELRIVINHLANLRIDGQAVPEDIVRQYRVAAQHPLVQMKVSALVEGASQGGRKAPHDLAYYRPVLDTIWELFGEDRVIYGSNWPVSALYAEYAVVQQVVQAYVSQQSTAAQRKFFAGNAAKVYRWPGA
jgi:L-fuconolactonase